jgi:Glycosyl hydrolase 36 superfamily, catalytic domain/Glycosyltransferase family 36
MWRVMTPSRPHRSGCRAGAGVMLVLALTMTGCTAKRTGPPSSARPGGGPGRPTAGPATAFGDGHFGHWFTDRFGLPAFAYTADQTTDPAARWNSQQGSSTSFWHQVGNDRVVAAAYNDGEVRLWDLERGYRLANAPDEPAQHFVGGYGYLNDGRRAWSTRWLDRPAGAPSRRVFGVGYFEQDLQANDVGVRQTVFAPFGDDPVLLAEVTLTNTAATAKTLQWFEYWDVNPRLVPARLGGPGPTVPQPVAGVRYDPRTRTLLALPRPGARPQPHTIFLSSLDEQVVHHEGSGSRFFGTGDRARPAEVRHGRLSDAGASPAEPTPMLALQATVRLAPGQRHILHYAYGYGDPATIAPLQQRLSTRPATALARSASAWRAALPRLRLPQDRWLERETAWNAYALRSSATYEEAWGAHLVSQGYAYQYQWGLNTAYRDPLQHVLPLIYTAPALARDTLRFAAHAQPRHGHIPIAFVGRRPSDVLGRGYQADDQDLWLLWTASEYVLATRDLAFLDQPEPYLDGGRGSVYDHLRTAFRHQLAGVGTGPHGEFRMQSGDWADFEGQNGSTESTPTTAQAAWVFPFFAQVAALHGDRATAAAARAAAARLTRVVASQWTGHWFNRGYKGNMPYGVDSLYLNPQPWAVLAGAATPAQVATLAANITRLLSAPSPIGAASQSASRGYGPVREQPTGKGTTGGVWYALNGPLVWAFAASAPALAWREYKANTHAAYAQAYPDNWFGVLSGPDAYDSFQAPSAGQAAIMDYPVQDPHAHAWQLYDTLKLAGIQPAAAGYTIDPHWPFPGFAWTSATVGVNYGTDRVSGHLRPLGAGTVTLSVRLPAGASGPVTACVDGKPSPVRVSGRFASWRMHLGKGRTSRWAAVTGPPGADPPCST